MYSAHPKDWEAGGTEAEKKRGANRCIYVLWTTAIPRGGPLSPSRRDSGGVTEEGWRTQADLHPTCLGSQTNHKEHPTNRNYSGRILTNGNYSWKAGLFLLS